MATVMDKELSFRLDTPNLMAHACIISTLCSQDRVVFEGVQKCLILEWLYQTRILLGLLLLRLQRAWFTLAHT